MNSAVAPSPPAQAAPSKQKSLVRAWGAFFCTKKPGITARWLFSKLYLKEGGFVAVVVCI